MKPVVAIIGRPNVGKSTLFNRITRRKDALVDNFPGVTRDRNYGEAVWDDHRFILIDTGGFISHDDDRFASHIRFQVEQAVMEADAVILVLDGKGGISPFDSDLIQWLRTEDRRVYYAVNKIDGPEQEDRLYEFYDLGLDAVYPVSAEHGYGVPDFLDVLVSDLPADDEPEDQQTIRIALIGRPNVGKSSLINKLVGEERVVVSDQPGTTRDAVDTLCHRDGRNYTLIDTAGIRKKAKVDRKLEKFSIIKALRSLDRCDVALIVLDGEQGITDQDIKVAGYAHERGCGTIWVANKWDLVDTGRLTPRRFEQHLRDSAKYLAYAPVITISALTGMRTKRLFPIINQVYDQYATRIGTGRINRIVNDATLHNEPSLHKGRRLKFYYSTQVSTRPPTFVSFVNYPEAVHFSYHRYLLNQIRTETKLDLVPLRLLFRQRSGKLTFGKKKKSRPPSGTRKK